VGAADERGYTRIGIQKRTWGLGHEGKGLQNEVRFDKTNSKVACKRYRPDSSLDARELAGELAQAIMSDPNLDLWVLAASRPVPDQKATALGEQAAASGVEVLFLDVGTDGLPRLVVLMAAYRQASSDWIKSHRSPAWDGDDTTVSGAESAFSVSVCNCVLTKRNLRGRYAPCRHEKS
jgi:hypothetical protein